MLLKYILLTIIFINFIFATENLEKVKIQFQWKNQYEFAGFYMAKEKGYYKDIGVDVDFIEFEPKIDIVDEVLNNNVQFGVWSSGLVAKWLNGNDIVLLSNYFKRSPLALITKPEIKFPADLIGKRIMIPKNDGRSANYQQMFKMFGINENNVTFLDPNFNLKNFNDTDAYSIFLTNEPYTFIKNSIPYNILDPNNYGVELNDVNLFTSNEFSKKNPKLVSDFIKASNKGWEYAINNIDETVETIFKKYNSQNKSKEALLFEANESQKFIQSKYYDVGKINIDKLEKIAKLYIELGLASKSKNINQFIYPNNLGNSTFSINELDFIKNNPIIKISNETDYPPFDFIIDDKPAGYSIDLLDLISKKTGLKFQYINGYKWSELVEMFKNKELDVLHSLTYTKEREKLGNFSDPYIFINNHFIIKNDSAQINNIKELNGKIVAVGKNWAVENYLYKNYPKINLLVLDSLKSILDAVANGQADAAIIDNLTAKYSIKKYGYSNLKISSWFKEYSNGKTLSYRFLIQKELSILNNIFNKTINSLTFEDLIALDKKWFDNNIKTENKFYLTNEEKKYLDNKKVITMCVDPDWTPLESLDKDGNHIGIAADIIKLMKDKTNLNINIVKTTSWNESVKKAQNRECDAFSLAMKTSKRNEYMDFTQSYLSYPFVITTSNDKIYINNIKSIIDKKIAVVKNYAISEILKEKYPNKKFIEVSSVKQGLELVNDKKVYAFVENLISIAYTIQKHNYLNIKISGEFDEKLNLSIATRNDEPILNSIMQKSLNLISEDEKQQIYNKWFFVKFEQEINYSILWKILGLTFIIILISFYWNTKLYNEKKKTKAALEGLTELQKELKLKNKELEKISITDKLTSLYNRHKIDEVLKYELLRFDRTKNSFGVIILDIDYFKLVNDNFGHNVGDSVLVKISELLKNTIRESDILGRWGGEEFILIIPETNKDDLIFLAQKLRRLIEEYNFEIIGNKTCSFGLTLSKEEDNSAKIIERADRALYLAKERGRNRVEFII